RIALHRRRYHPGFDADSGKRPGAVHRPGQVVRNDQYPPFLSHLIFTTETQRHGEPQELNSKEKRNSTLIAAICTERIFSLASPLNFSAPLCLRGQSHSEI